MLAALALLLTLPASAQRTDHETFRMLGWNNGCSAAVEDLGYAKLGEAIQGIPIYAWIGTITIPPGHEAQKARWYYQVDDQRDWNAKSAEKTEARLAGLGYRQPGYHEAVRPDPVSPGGDLSSLIGSTGTFRTDSPGPWPDTRWRLSSVYYDSIGACGLLVYTPRGADDRFQLLLARFGNVAARRDRAAAHLNNALALLKSGDEEGALAETGIAAEMAPKLPPARYQHAALLKLTGHMRRAVRELKAAIALDPSYARKWESDPDFGPMNGFPDFAQLMRAR